MVLVVVAVAIMKHTNFSTTKKKLLQCINVWDSEWVWKKWWHENAMVTLSVELVPIKKFFFHAHSPRLWPFRYQRYWQCPIYSFFLLNEQHSIRFNGSFFSVTLICSIDDKNSAQKIWNSYFREENEMSPVNWNDQSISFDLKWSKMAQNFVIWLVNDFKFSYMKVIEGFSGPSVWPTKSPLTISHGEYWSSCVIFCPLCDCVNLMTVS